VISFLTAHQQNIGHRVP